MSEADSTIKDVQVALESDSKPSLGISTEDFLRVVRSKLFAPAAFATIALMFAFWGLLREVPGIWLKNEYYSHGFLVPLISGYVVYRWWPRIGDTKVKSAPWGFIFILVSLCFGYVGFLADTESVQCWAFIFAFWSSILVVAGWDWARKVALPVAYLGFALPTFGTFIEEYTNPMQIISSKVAFEILTLLGFQPMHGDATTVLLNHYTLDVAAPCSGLKLIVALSSFVVFFMMIGNLRWWANVLLGLVSLPLAVFINSLRISLIGVVGELYGSDAGHKFHDYSGYLTLILCFVLLFQFVRFLGWKD